jgi:hypothetical protein
MGQKLDAEAGVDKIYSRATGFELVRRQTNCRSNADA